jgi:hypothetical protein
MKVIRLIKVYLNETYNKVCIGKHLSDSFPIQNGLKQLDVPSLLLFNFALEYATAFSQVKPTLLFSTESSCMLEKLLM